MKKCDRVSDLALLVPRDHPLRLLRPWVNHSMRRLEVDFPEIGKVSSREISSRAQLLRAAVLQVFYGLRDDKHFIEHLNYNLLFRWFIGFAFEDSVWNTWVFIRLRDNLVSNEKIIALMEASLLMMRGMQLDSTEYFQVDKTLLTEWRARRDMMSIALG